MSTLTTMSDLRAAIIAGLIARTGLANIDGHGGTFSEAEIKRFSLNAPAVRVAVLGHGALMLHGSGQWAAPVRCVAVVIAKDIVTAGAPKVERDVAALLLANAVSAAVAGNQWGLDGVANPEAVTARNEYSGVQDGTGLAMWQVVWTQPLYVSAPVNMDDGTLNPPSLPGTIAALYINPVLFGGTDPNSKVAAADGAADDAAMTAGIVAIAEAIP